MTHAQHSPGPWVIDGHDLSSVIRCVTPKGSPSAKHVCGDYVNVAKCVSNNWAVDARLISAAPELLDAICDALVFVEDAFDDPATGKQARACSKKIRAAIAKAEGR